MSGKSTIWAFQVGTLPEVPAKIQADYSTGLLPLLKSIQKPGNLKKYSGQTLGVDAYGWLHRGIAACAIDLALEKPTTKYGSSFTGSGQ